MRSWVLSKVTAKVAGVLRQVAILLRPSLRWHRFTKHTYKHGYCISPCAVFYPCPLTMQCQQAPSWSRLAQPQFKACKYLSLSVNGSVHSFLAYRQRRTLRPRTLCCYSQYKLLLYTKPDCPLCDGLKVDHQLDTIDR